MEGTLNSQRILRERLMGFCSSIPKITGWIQDVCFHALLHRYIYHNQPGNFSSTRPIHLGIDYKQSFWFLQIGYNIFLAHSLLIFVLSCTRIHEIYKSSADIYLHVHALSELPFPPFTFKKCYPQCSQHRLYLISGRVTYMTRMPCMQWQWAAWANRQAQLLTCYLQSSPLLLQ